MDKPTTNSGGFTSQLETPVEAATFSTFKSKKATKPSGTQSASALIDEVKSDAHKPLCDKIRSEPDKDKRSELKSRLPAVTGSGVFSARPASALEEHSGFLIADIDLDANKHLEDAKTMSDLRFDLCTSPHVAFLFKSPSGGLKVGFCIDESDHDAAFKTVKYFMKEERDVTIDKSCSDVSRLCFLSHDPQAWYNKTATKLVTIEVAEEVAPQAVNRAATKSFDSKKTVAASRPVKPNDIETARSALAAIPANPDYGVWIKIIAATVAMVGESVAVELLQAWSPEKDVDSYTAKVRNGLDSVGAGTLIHIAKEHSWSQPRKRKSAPTVAVDAFVQGMAKRTEPEIVEKSKPVKVAFKLNKHSQKLVDAGIVTEEWALAAFDLHGPIEKPEQMPVGRLAVLYEAVERRARFSQPELNLMSALVTGGALISNMIESDNEAYTAILAMGVARSSYGKDAGLRAPSMIIGALEKDTDAVVGTMKSKEALEQSMSENNRCMMVLDEVGHKLAAAKNDSHTSQVASLITELWNGQDYKGSRAISRDRYSVDRPRLSVYVTGSPDRISDALSIDSILDGELPRYLFATGREVDRRYGEKEPDNKQDVINDIVKAFGNFLDKGQADEHLNAISVKVNIAKTSPDAAKLLKEYSVLSKEHGDDSVVKGAAELWHKGGQNVGRVALIHAALRADTLCRVMIEVVDVTFAIEVVNYSIKGWVDFSHDIAQTPRAKILDDMIAHIKRHPMGVKHRDFHHKFSRLKGGDKFEELLLTLIETEEISNEPGRGRGVYHVR